MDRGISIMKCFWIHPCTVDGKNCSTQKTGIMEKSTEKREVELREKVERYLKRDDRLHDDKIKVSVTGDTVSLEGKVNSHYAMRIAENIAYTVMGVKLVENYLAVEPSGTYMKPSDLEIEKSIRSTLLWNSAIDSNDLDVTVTNGKAELNGSLYSYHEMRLAEEITYTINGVNEVVNNIVVNTRHDTNDELIADNVFEALDSDPMVNAADIDISINNGLVTLSGSVQDYVAANAAHDALLYIPGVRGIVNNINIG